MHTTPAMDSSSEMRFLSLSDNNNNNKAPIIINTNNDESSRVDQEHMIRPNHVVSSLQKNTKGHPALRREPSDDTTVASTYCSMLSDSSSDFFVKSPQRDARKRVEFEIIMEGPALGSPSVRFDLEATQYYKDEVNSFDGENDQDGDDCDQEHNHDRKQKEALHYSPLELQGFRAQAMRDVTILVLTDQKIKNRHQTTATKSVSSTLVKVRQTCQEMAASDNGAFPEAVLFEQQDDDDDDDATSDSAARSVAALYVSGDDNDDDSDDDDNDNHWHHHPTLPCILGLERYLVEQSQRSSSRPKSPTRYSCRHNNNDNSNHTSVLLASSDAESRRRSILWRQKQQKHHHDNNKDDDDDAASCYQYCQHVSLPSRLWAHATALGLARAMQQQQKRQEA